MRKMVAVGVSILSAVGCAATSAPEEKPGPDVTLDGIYVATSETPKAVTAVAFHDGRYRLVPAGCVEAACEENGTFSIEDGGRRLELTSDAGAHRSSPMITSLQTKALVEEPSQVVDTSGKMILEKVELLGEPVALFMKQAQIPEAVIKSVQACIDQVDYNKLPVDYEAAGETYTHRSGSVAWQAVEWIGGATLKAVDESASFRNWVDSLTWGTNQGETLLTDIVKQVNKKFADAASAGAPFQNYQKVCLAQCISSRIIKYAESAVSKFGGASVAVGQGVGVCTEFSSIAMRIIDDTAGSSVQSWRGLSPGHSFVQVKFDGYTYSIEPQRDPQSDGECTFYR